MTERKRKDLKEEEKYNDTRERPPKKSDKATEPPNEM
jgi:hypothetical protein